MYTVILYKQFNGYSLEPVAIPAFYGYSGSSLTVSQNIAKTVNEALKTSEKTKNSNNLSSRLIIVKRLYLYNYNKTLAFINCARFQQKN